MRGVIAAVMIAFAFLLSCATSQRFVPQEPREGRSLLVGGILLENHGIEDLYQAKKAGILVKVVGRSVRDGEEVIDVYRLVTDRNGYFIKQNVPPGSYVIKGVEVYLAPNSKTLVRAFWDGPLMYYELTEREFDYAVRIWPDPIDEKIINMNILHLEVGIGSGRDVVYDIYRSLQNQVLGLPGVRHTMPNPVEYYQARYPDLAWFGS
ncbi:MAG TPA: hypothetical protein VKA68_14180 [bacterium]|nr:hypothetical protein [bacterium]